MTQSVAPNQATDPLLEHPKRLLLLAYETSPTRALDLDACTVYAERKRRNDQVGQEQIVAGAVKDRKNQRATASDWMELEKQRGISISSTVMLPMLSKLMRPAAWAASAASKMPIAGSSTSAARLGSMVT